MLVLTRRVGDIIEIGRATVKVIEVRGHQVRLGIEAPEDVRVVRGEVAAPDQKRPPRRS